MALSGSCHCGAIAYEVDALASPIVHCHCITCQKVQGASHATTARVDRTAFRWLRGEEDVRAYESTPGKLRRFCGLCGSHLFAEWVDQPALILRVANLDGDPGARPVVHIWTSHERPWLTDERELPRMEEGVPPRPLAEDPA